jgi:hypothetical protein
MTRGAADTGRARRLPPSVAVLDTEASYRLERDVDASGSLGLATVDRTRWRFRSAAPAEDLSRALLDLDYALAGLDARNRLPAAGRPLSPGDPAPTGRRAQPGCGGPPVVLGRRRAELEAAAASSLSVVNCVVCGSAAQCWDRGFSNRITAAEPWRAV